MNCNCNKNEILTIPWGNPFRLFVCGDDIMPGKPDAVLSEVSDIRAYIVCRPNLRTEVAYEIDGSDIILTVPRDKQLRTTYCIEITGTYNGLPWRWRTMPVFRIAKTNCEATMQGLETFGTETYYLRDVVWVIFDGPTMALISHGHVQIYDETMELQDADETTFEIEENILYITTEN